MLEVASDIYGVPCPYCKKHLESIECISMPWRQDEELIIECPYCENDFEIRPKYKFEGFFIYSDDEQMEKYKEE